MADKDWAYQIALEIYMDQTGQGGGEPGGCDVPEIEKWAGALRNAYVSGRVSMCKCDCHSKGFLHCGPCICEQIDRKVIA